MGKLNRATYESQEMVTRVFTINYYYFWQQYDVISSTFFPQLPESPSRGPRPALPLAGPRPALPLPGPRFLSSREETN